MHPDRDSPTCPGEKSSISDPIPLDLVESMEEFFDEVYDSFQEQTQQTDWMVLKEVVNIEHGPGDNTTKVVLDGKKLKEKGFSEDGKDFWRVWCRFKADRERWELTSIIYDPAAQDGSVVSMEQHARFLKDEEDGSFKIESWCMQGGNVRRAGMIWAKMVEFIYLKPLLAFRHFASKVKVHFGVDSAESGGKSVFTGSLDDFFKDDGELFDVMLHAVKMDDIEKERPIEIRSEEEYEVRWQEPWTPWGQEPNEHNVHLLDFERRVVMDRKRKNLTQHFFVGSDILNNVFFRIHKEPLRVETWFVKPNGYRTGSGPEAQLFRIWIHKLVNDHVMSQEVQDLQGQRSFFF